MVDPVSTKKGQKAPKGKQYPRSGGFNGSKSLRFEDLELNKLYAISLNPAEFPIAVKDMLVWYRKLYDFLFLFRSGIELILYPESSPIGRMHFHGTIKILNFHIYFDFLNQLAGVYNYEIDTIATVDKATMEWGEYISKQHHIWKPIFEASLIGYPMKIHKDSKCIDANHLPGQKVRKKQNAFEKFEM